MPHVYISAQWVPYSDTVPRALSVNAAHRRVNFTMRTHVKLLDSENQPLDTVYRGPAEFSNCVTLACEQACKFC